VQQKRIKALEAESKLKQGYVPPFSRKSTRVSGPQGETMVLGREAMEGYPQSKKYSWSLFKKFHKFSPCLIPEDCFVIDKSFNTAARLAQLRPGLIIEPGSPSKAGGKTRAAFFLRTTPLTRAARRVTSMRLKHFARRPHKLIDMKALRAEAMPHLNSQARVAALTLYRPRARARLSEMCVRLGQVDRRRQDWLVINNLGGSMMGREAFPRPAKRPDGSYVYERVPSVGQQDFGQGGRSQMQLYKKRHYEEKVAQAESTSITPSKVGKGVSGQAQVRGYSINQVSPKGTRKIATLTRVAGGQKTVISWQDAPDDLFFRAGTTTKKTRNQLTVAAIRRAARRPFRRVM